MKSCDRVSDFDKKKVCMFVFNNFTHDSRVLKEASSLAEIGYSVTVVARLDDYTLPFENINGIKVQRIPVNPFHLKFINLIRKSTRRHISVNKKSTAGYGSYGQEESYKSLEPATRDRPTTLTQEMAPRSTAALRTRIIVISGWGSGPAQSIPLELFRKGVRRIARNVRRIARNVRRRIARNVRRIARKYERRILDRGIKNAMVSFLMKFHRPLLILDFNYRILKSVNVEKYNVFHAHDLNTLIGAYLAAKKQGASLIYDSHELYLERNRLEPYKPIGKWIRKKVEAYLIRRSDCVITVNDSLARMLADTYKVKPPTVVMNAPNLQKASVASQYVPLRHALGIRDDHRILLYSGSITFNRGLENLIEALVYLPQCFLVLMGYSNDTYKNKLKTIAVEKGVASRLTFFGPVPSDQVTLYAGSADLGVAAIENVCLSYYYCAPNKLFEYLLAGLPVIASDFPEMSHIINQYGVGGTFDPSSPKDIARAAMEILGAPEKWRNIKEKTDAVALTYNWENESRKLIDIYQSLS